MKLSELTIVELNNLINLLTTYNNYIVKQMHIITDGVEYKQLFQLNSQIQKKIKMIYEEIKKRLNSIEE